MHVAWAGMAHAHFLNGLMQATRWQSGELAFHGGTNLHLCWQSARYSEDLDFLLSSASKHMGETIARTARYVAQAFQALDPSFEVELRDRTRDAQRMIVYHLVVSHPRVVGHAMVKLEFWRTTPSYLQRYATTLREIRGPADFRAGIRSLVPSATLQCAFADKLVALSTRPHLKWRDLYDMWWIESQHAGELDEEEVLEQYCHNLQAYDTFEGLPAHEAVGHLFRRHSREEMLSLAQRDLQPWLPQALWQQLYPQRLNEVVGMVQARVERVSQLLLERDHQGRRCVSRSRA
jgi:predicted nucleotidyltransferase component of viral defense system